MNLIKSALHSLDTGEARDTAYDRGLVVGIVSALMHSGMSYDRAIAAVAKNMPGSWLHESVPGNWLHDILEASDA